MIRWAISLLLLLPLVLVAPACGGSSPPPSRNRNSAVLLINVDQPDATIWVDGRFVAAVEQARGGVAVSPGRHRLEVRHDRFHSHYANVEVRSGERRKLEVELAEELP